MVETLMGKLKSLENKYIGNSSLYLDLANFYKKQVLDQNPWDVTSPGLEKWWDSNSSRGGSKPWIVS